MRKEHRFQRAKKRIRPLIAVLLVGSIGIAAVANGLRAEPGVHSRAKFNWNGELIRPQGYREWVFVGAPVTPNDLNNGAAAFPEFHSVYIDPDSWKHYKKTGEFRDGTILVKELISVGSKAATSGKGYFMGSFIGLEATVKNKKRFPNEPGNWAYFSFTVTGSPMKGDAFADHGKPLKPLAKAFPAETCAACHAAAAQQDIVFTQYYPVLRAAKAGAKN